MISPATHSSRTKLKLTLRLRGLFDHYSYFYDYDYYFRYSSLTGAKLACKDLSLN